MSQQLFDYLLYNLDTVLLSSQLSDVKSIVKGEYINSNKHNVPSEAIVVYGKSEGKIVYFRIFNYPDEQYIAKAEFDRLMNDLSIGEYQMMTIDKFNELLEEGSRVLDL